MFLMVVLLWFSVFCFSEVVVLVIVCRWLCSEVVVLVVSRLVCECVNSISLSVCFSVLMWWLIVGCVMFRVCVVLESDFLFSMVRKEW